MEGSVNGNGNHNGYWRSDGDALTPALQPHDPVAERALLGAILLNRDVMIAVAPVVSKDDFFITSHALIYDAMRTLYERRTPPDHINVSAYLRERGMLERVGGVDALIALEGEGVMSYHAEHYARVVRSLADRRRLIAAGAKIATLGYNEPDADAAYAQALAALYAAHRRQRTAATLGEAFDELIAMYRSDEPRGVHTGIAGLDELTGGLMPGDLTIIAGRPGHGKTALALTIAERVARQGRTVAFFSLEMTRHELAQRLLARATGVPVRMQRRAALTDVQLMALIGAMGEIGDLPLLIDDTRRMTADDVCARAHAIARERDGLALVVVDYIQLLTIKIERGGTYAQALGEASQALKILAREIDAPVLALAQVNREIDHRADRAPQLSDLRDSGRLEADADQVIIVVRPELYSAQPQSNGGVVRLHLLKNRHDRTGVVEARFDGAASLVA